jgi:hypothetical protein
LGVDELGVDELGVDELGVVHNRRHHRLRKV